MALRYWSACAAWLAYEFIGSRCDAHHVRGMGVVLFAAICTTNLADVEIKNIPEDDIGYSIIALSLMLCPGILWGLALFWLLTGEEMPSACVWLVVSPVLVATLGISSVAVVGAERQRTWHAANGLGVMGILAGHFLSYSLLGQTINNYLSGLAVTAGPSILRILTGVTSMAFSVLRMVQNRLRDDRRHPSHKRTTAAFETRPISLKEVFNVILWTFGLASCVSAIDNAHARATLVSGSVALVFPMTFSPPSMRKVWRHSYGTYVRYFVVVHVAVAVLCSLYDALLQDRHRVPSTSGYTGMENKR